MKSWLSCSLRGCIRNMAVKRVLIGFIKSSSSFWLKVSSPTRMSDAAAVFVFGLTIREHRSKRASRSSIWASSTAMTGKRPLAVEVMSIMCFWSLINNGRLRLAASTPN